MRIRRITRAITMLALMVGAFAAAGCNSEPVGQGRVVHVMMQPT